MKIVASQIEIDDQGVAWIAGANTNVIEVGLDKLAYGWSPEEMHFQHRHLSLAQGHAALPTSTSPTFAFLNDKIALLMAAELEKKRQKLPFGNKRRYMKAMHVFER